jgi:hypothetical protein
MPPVKLGPEVIDSVVARYVAGENLVELAAAFNVHKATVLSSLHRAGVSIRSKADAARLYHARRRVDDGLSPALRAYRKAKAEGRCPGCGKPSGGTVNCHACRQKAVKRRKDQVAKGLCQCCSRPLAPGYTRCQECVEKTRTYHYQLRKEAFVAYGGARCICCGIDNAVFLCLDHIANDGAHDRRTNGDGTQYLRKLKKAGWPKGFQVLCHNCNFAKSFAPDGCPHMTQ